ncbi:hypothetical protein H4Q26_004478 [Puccinia striiformis f. sp. tritici PST-130]|nr:hypothetical protein H4Q26_004478 [Puccinia striiformis f. sp. tritici PST-130]
MSIFAETAHVVAGINHHQPKAGNTRYRSANPCLIQVPTGSRASLVAHYSSFKLSSNLIPTGVLISTVNDHR